MNYTKANKNNWTGRASNPSKGKQYWYQAIETASLEEVENTDIALLGYQCEEGVRRNLGRIGAADAPDKVRERLAKLPLHFTKKVTDVGNIICIGDALEACQQDLTNAIEKLLNNNIFPIAIGGGHDIAYGHFRGIRQAISKDKKIGIINFDAHFDLRPVEDKPNSGTPFNQILKEFNNVHYTALGIQQQGNTKELFEIAKENNVAVILNDACELSNIEALKKQLTPIINSCDYLYVSIDMDGFSSAYAMGVSAPSPLGFTPNFAIKMLDFIFASKKVISCDVAEFNPKFDVDNATATLTARLIDHIVKSV